MATAGLQNIEDQPTISSGEGGVSGIQGISDPAVQQQSNLAEKLKLADSQSNTPGAISTDPYKTNQEVQDRYNVDPNAGAKAKAKSDAERQAGFDQQYGAAAKALAEKTPKPLTEVKPLVTTDKPKETKTTTKATTETTPTYQSPEKVAEARAYASSLYNLDEARDDTHKAELEQLQKLEVANSIQSQKSEMLLTKRLKESRDFGQGIGNTLQRSLLRDLNANFINARATISNTFSDQIAALNKQESDSINAEASSVLKEERQRDFDNKRISLQANMDLFSSLPPDGQIALASSLSEQYPEITYFSDVANSPEVQDALRKAYEPEQQAIMTAAIDKAGNLAFQAGQLLDAPGSEAEEAVIKDEWRKQFEAGLGGETLFNTEVERWTKGLSEDSSILLDSMSRDEAELLIENINSLDPETVKEAFVDYRFALAKKAAINANLRSVLTNEFVSTVDTPEETKQALNLVDQILKSNGSDTSGKFAFGDDGKFSGFTLKSGETVSDPSQIPGFNLVFQDWDGNDYGGSLSKDMDSEYFTYLDDKYTNYLNNATGTPVSREEFKANLEEGLASSGVDFSNSDLVDSDKLPDLKGDTLKNMAEKITPQVTDPNLGNVGGGVGAGKTITLADITDEAGDIATLKVDSEGDKLQSGSRNINSLDDNIVRNIFNNLDEVGTVRKDQVVSGMVKQAKETGTTVLGNSFFKINGRDYEVNKSIDEILSLSKNEYVLMDTDFIKGYGSVSYNINKNGENPNAPQLSTFWVRYRS
jgi:hypothetical protein